MKKIPTALLLLAAARFMDGMRRTGSDAGIGSDAGTDANLDALYETIDICGKY